MCEAESSEVAAEVAVEVEELISKAAVVKFGRTIRLYSYKIIERKILKWVTEDFICHSWCYMSSSWRTQLAEARDSPFLASIRKETESYLIPRTTDSECNNGTWEHGPNEVS